MKILLFIRSLEMGGAERQLLLTAQGLAKCGHSVAVLTFYEGGFYTAELEQSNIRLLSLKKQGRWDLLGFYFRLIKVLRQESVDVIYSFLDSANIFSVLCKPFISSTKIIWGVRASNMNLAAYPWISRWSYQAEICLSRFTDKIIANSFAGVDYAIEKGFPKEKLVVIHNGIETDKFKPDKKAGERLRTSWGVSSGQLLIGLIGRIHPVKGHAIFLQAAALLNSKIPGIRFVCVGDGEMVFRQKIQTLARSLGVENGLIWAGKYTHMPAVYNALDLLVSSSFGEGFSNVIAEAMACNVPCVVTDVGDSALIVGTTGQCVPASNAALLADAILIQLAVQTNGEIYRNRIQSLYALEQMIAKTEAVIEACCLMDVDK